MSETNTDVAYKSFVHGSVTANCQQTLDWIQSMELKRDQIISITMSETQIEEGQSLLTVFYRIKSLAADAPPFDQMQFREFTKTKTWESQAKEAENLAQTGCQVISLCHSAKNVMSLKNQILWYANDSASVQYSFHYVKETSGDWDALFKKSLSYLNKHIAPHQLVHVSFFEGAHPNEPVEGEQNIYCSIIHTAGSSPAELRSIPNHSLPPQLYTKTLIKGEGSFEDYFSEAKNAMNKFGGENGHIVASANVTSESEKGASMVCVISWQKLLAASLEDQMRPTGCSCAIF